MINRKEIVYIASPAYYPNRAMHVAATIDELNSERALIVFVPEILDWRARLSESDFLYLVLVTFAHEMIHLERAHDRVPPVEVPNAEAEAWGITVLEIIRPLQAIHFIRIEEFRKLSALLKALNDNYNDPRWVKTFRPR